MGKDVLPGKGLLKREKLLQSRDLNMLHKVVSWKSKLILQNKRKQRNSIKDKQGLHDGEMDEGHI